jgi:hypothetical protein
MYRHPTRGLTIQRQSGRSVLVVVGLRALLSCVFAAGPVRLEASFEFEPST